MSGTQIRHYFLLVAMFLFLPSLVKADIIISEVAWMGTSASANDEWFELYNSGSGSVNLSGYSVSWAESGTPKHIDLSGTLGSGEYYLLERTDDTTVPDKTANLIYAGALSNSGEKILLRSGSTVLQTLDNSGGWQAGDNTTKETMQWNGSTWITASPTPGSGSLVVSDDGGDDGGGSGGDDEDGGGNEDDSANQNLSTYQASNQNTSSANFSIQTARSKNAIVGMPVDFTSIATPNNLAGADYTWSFGDGATGLGKNVSHIYLADGSYTAVARVRVGEQSAMSKIIVNVGAFDVSISKIEPGTNGYIEFANKSKQDVNLGGYIIVGKDKYYILPQDFVVSAGARVRLPAMITGFALSPNEKVELCDNSGKTLSSYKEESKIEKAVLISASSTTALFVAQVPIAVPKVVRTPETGAGIQAAPVLVFERKHSFGSTFLSLPRRLISSILNLLTG